MYRPSAVHCRVPSKGPSVRGVPACTTDEADAEASKRRKYSQEKLRFFLSRVFLQVFKDARSRATWQIGFKIVTYCKSTGKKSKDARSRATSHITVESNYYYYYYYFTRLLKTFPEAADNFPSRRSGSQTASIVHIQMPLVDDR